MTKMKPKMMPQIGKMRPKMANTRPKLVHMSPKIAKITLNMAQMGLKMATCTNMHAHIYIHRSTAHEVIFIEKSWKASPVAILAQAALQPHLGFISNLLPALRCILYPSDEVTRTYPKKVHTMSKPKRHIWRSRYRNRLARILLRMQRTVESLSIQC